MTGLIVGPGEPVVRNAALKHSRRAFHLSENRVRLRSALCFTQLLHNMVERGCHFSKPKLQNIGVCQDSTGWLHHHGRAWSGIKYSICSARGDLDNEISSGHLFWIELDSLAWTEAAGCEGFDAMLNPGGMTHESGLIKHKDTQSQQ